MKDLTFISNEIARLFPALPLDQHEKVCVQIEKILAFERPQRVPVDAQGLKDAAGPLMKWLATNCHPHVTCIVDSTRAELVEGLAVVLNDGVAPTPTPGT